MLLWTGISYPSSSQVEDRTEGHEMQLVLGASRTADGRLWRKGCFFLTTDMYCWSCALHAWRCFWQWFVYDWLSGGAGIMFPPAAWGALIDWNNDRWTLACLKIVWVCTVPTWGPLIPSNWWCHISKAGKTDSTRSFQIVSVSYINDLTKIIKQTKKQKHSKYLL